MRKWMKKLLRDRDKELSVYEAAVKNLSRKVSVGDRLAENSEFIITSELVIRLHAKVLSYIMEHFECFNCT